MIRNVKEKGDYKIIIEFDTSQEKEDLMKYLSEQITKNIKTFTKVEK